MKSKLREKLPGELEESDAEEELNALAEEIKIHDLRYYNAVSYTHLTLPTKA